MDAPLAWLDGVLGALEPPLELLLPLEPQADTARSVTAQSDTALTHLRPRI